MSQDGQQDQSDDAQPAPAAPPPKTTKNEPPQESVKRFWDKLNTRYPGRVFTVLPDNQYALKKAAKAPKGVVQGQRAAKSYDQAREDCIRDVQKIIKECRRENRKYRDPHFDIEWDLKCGRRDCLDGLRSMNEELLPKGIKRVTEIFEKPVFYSNGPTAGDVRQGRDGDCYLLAGLSGLGNMKGLIEKVCVIEDQAVGVYGFVFFRDGEWQQCIIDDKLYLHVPDYDEAIADRIIWDNVARKNTEDEYRKVHQTGLRALYFSQCSDDNETWLPLLEKAYAKAHGDYTSINGGFTGEAIEDLTGGVTMEFFSTDILDKDDFWKNQLCHVGEEFLFGCATGIYSSWLSPFQQELSGGERKGIYEHHAYSIMEAVEKKGIRLLKLRNPWGKSEWGGAWSDGSEEWTPEWMELLDHRFGNDGIFWISYEDMLKKFQTFDRTRIFGPEWLITQQWTSLHVPWSADYHSTKFSVTLERKSPVVLVLSQLDTRYFTSLEGGYDFNLQFRVEKDGDEEEDYIVRSHSNYAMTRSVSQEVTLDAGTYSVLIKIIATRNGNEAVEDVVPQYAETRRDKLVQIGLSHDLAYAKGVIVESDKEKAVREAREKRQKDKDREKVRMQLKAQAKKTWAKDKKRHAREERAEAKKQQAEAARAAREAPAEPEENAKAKVDDDAKENGEVPESNEATEEFEFNDIQQVADEPGGEEASGSKKPSEVSLEEILSAEVGPPVSDLPMPASAADSVVGPLSAVIARADAETAANAAMPTIQINGNEAVTDIKPLANQPDTTVSEAIYDNLSEPDSYPDFDWQTDLDMESEAEEDGASPSAPNGDEDEGGKDKDSEPWNAVCVVGLRVYSQDPDLSLEVVRPKIEDDGEAVLDRDDASKGAAENKLPAGSESREGWGW